MLPSETTTIKNLSAKKALIVNHEILYYGVRQNYTIPTKYFEKPKNELERDVKTIENILKKYIKDFVCFLNFTTDSRIRMLVYYNRKNSGFIGVSYKSIDELHKLKELKEPEETEEAES